MQLRRLNRRTQEAYLGWLTRFYEFHGRRSRRSPADLGSREVTGFLSWLATDRCASTSTQNQALAAILFLYRYVLELPLPWLDDLVRTKECCSLRVSG